MSFSPASGLNKGPGPSKQYMCFIEISEASKSSKMLDSTMFLMFLAVLAACPRRAPRAAKSAPGGPPRGMPGGSQESRQEASKERPKRFPRVVLQAPKRSRSSTVRCFWHVLEGRQERPRGVPRETQDNEEGPRSAPGEPPGAPKRLPRIGPGALQEGGWKGQKLLKS